MSWPRPLDYHEYAWNMKYKAQESMGTVRTALVIFDSPSLLLSVSPLFFEVFERLLASVWSAGGS